MIVGYARVSTDGQRQGLDAQLASGKSARGMIIIDRKDMYLTPVDTICAPPAR